VSKPRLAIVETNASRGGAERVLWEFARRVRDRADVTIVTTPGTDNPYFADLQVERPLRFSLWVHRLRKLDDMLGFGLFRPLVALLGRLDSRWVGRFDSIIFNKVENLRQFSYLRVPGEKKVVYLHSHQLQYTEPIYDRELLSDVSLFIGFEGRQEQELRAELPEARFLLCPHGVDGGAVRRVEPSTFDDDGDVHRILYVSRLGPQRPFEFFLFALSLFLETHGDCVLHVVGAGQLSLEQERLVDFLGIRDRIRFEGHTDDVARTLVDLRPNVVWLPTLGNMPGLISLEMMLHRAPIVFWNWDPECDFLLYGSTRLQEFVDLTAAMLEDREIKRREIERNHEFVTGRHDASNYDRILDALGTPS
jgi:glycosyltransferase involved in cell wall biosynthesis